MFSMFDIASVYKMSSNREEFDALLAVLDTEYYRVLARDSRNPWRRVRGLWAARRYRRALDRICAAQARIRYTTNEERVRDLARVHAMSVYGLRG